MGRKTPTPTASSPKASHSLFVAGPVGGRSNFDRRHGFPESSDSEELSS